MKTLRILIGLLPVCFFSSSNATNYTNNGTSQVYNLNNGDTLRITGGTYTGNLNSFTNYAVIIISAGATFQPHNINTPSGKIINYGVSAFGSIGTYSNFQFENYNLISVTGDLALYDGNTQTWTNNIGATIKISGNFSMNNAVVTNYSSFTVGGKFAMYSSTSQFINRGSLSIAGDLNMSNGILTNQNKISVDDFNGWGGQFNNEGSISPKGKMVFSNGTTYTNKCLLITNSGFTNHGNFTNNGLLWVGRSGTDNDHFLNSGTFTNAANAAVRAVKFTNYDHVAGGGSYYITGNTYNSGTVGRSGTTTDTIKVYDLSRSTSSSIFDVQYGTVHANVVYRNFTQPDTNQVNYAGCSSFFRTNSAAILPVVWNYFNVALIQNQPTITWSAQYEPNMKFEVQRSYDNVHFTTISTLFSVSGRAYSYSDVTIQKNRLAYYRIKGTSSVNSEEKYTETKTVKTAATDIVFDIYPNPVRNASHIQYRSEITEAVMLRISNAAGQLQLQKNATATTGFNRFSLTEITTLPDGVYFIELSNSTEVIARSKFIKQQ